MPAPTPDEPAEDAERTGEQRRRALARSRAARRPTRGRRALPWSERSVLVASLLMVVLSAPLWLDPLTLAGLLGVVPSGPSPAATPLLPGRFDGPGAAPTTGAGRLIASDTFSRRVTDGWGSADVGGTYELVGRTSTVAVQPAVGVVELAGGADGALLLPLAARDVSIDFTVALDRPPTGGELELRVVMRRNAGADAFMPALHLGAGGAVSAGAAITVDGDVERLGGRFAVRELDALDEAVLRIRAEASGSDPTTIRLRAWPAGAPEPNYWHVSVIDWTGTLQGAGAVGLGWRLDPGAAPLTLHYDDLNVTTTDGGQR